MIMDIFTEPTQGKIIGLIALIVGLLYYYYRETRLMRKHFPKVNPVDVLGRIRRKNYYK